MHFLRKVLVSGYNRVNFCPWIYKDVFQLPADLGPFLNTTYDIQSFLMTVRLIKKQTLFCQMQDKVRKGIIWEFLKWYFFYKI